MYVNNTWLALSMSDLYFMTGSPSKPESVRFELDPSGQMLTLTWRDGAPVASPIYGHLIQINSTGNYDNQCTHRCVLFCIIVDG